jgi:hypothetical protein
MHNMCEHINCSDCHAVVRVLLLAAAPMSTGGLANRLANRLANHPKRKITGILTSNV